jgi:hypothetical protein
MKKLNLKLGGLGQMLTKVQMKNITGGYNPNCGGDTTLQDWYCGTVGNCTFLGHATCDDADAHCTTGLHTATDCAPLIIV